MASKNKSSELQSLKSIINQLSAINTQTSEHLTEPEMNTSEPIVANNFNPLSVYLCVELMEPTAILPSKNKISDAGYDLHSFETYSIPAGGSQIISTKIKINIPNGYYGRIASRSGLACKSNIEVGAGVIDQNYQGEIMVLLRNFGKIDYLVNKGERVAQIILSPYLNLPVLKVNSIIEIFGYSDRGEKGFGSSGK